MLIIPPLSEALFEIDVEVSTFKIVSPYEDMTPPLRAKLFEKEDF